LTTIKAPEKAGVIDSTPEEEEAVINKEAHPQHLNNRSVRANMTIRQQRRRRRRHQQHH
jgi:hypothetical protein